MDDIQSLNCLILPASLRYGRNWHTRKLAMWERQSGQNQDPNTNGQQHISSTPQLLIHASSSCSLLATELSPEVDRSIPTRAGEEGTHTQALLSDSKTLALKRGLFRDLYYSIIFVSYGGTLPPGMQIALP